MTNLKIALFGFLFFAGFGLGFFGLGVSWEREHAKAATAPQSVCSRCGTHLDTSLMQKYSAEGKPDILICPKCVYDQAASFLKFCPVDE